MKENFLGLYFRMFYKPGITFGEIFESGKALKYSFFAFLILSAGTWKSNKAKSARKRVL
jgi:hypothetical protein